MFVDVACLIEQKPIIESDAVTLSFEDHLLMKAHPISSI